VGGMAGFLASLSTKDRVIVGGLIFFCLFNVTIDLYLVHNSAVLAERAATNWIAYGWSFYAEAADRWWIVGPWSRAQEAFNIYVSTLVNLWLFWAIVTRSPYRYPIQLGLGAYMVYSLVLYHLAGHLSGYDGMREKSLYAFALYYGAGVPWTAFHLYLAWDAFAAIGRRFVEPRARA
jgi:hypothetical protein